jgi:hypothetical protein
VKEEHHWLKDHARAVAEHIHDQVSQSASTRHIRESRPGQKAGGRVSDCRQPRTNAKEDTHERAPAHMVMSCTRM